MTKNKLVLFTLLAVLITAALAFAFSMNQGDERPAMQYAKSEKTILDVPYEPSPVKVVEEMIRLAKVTERDLVYDLGCGDGRVVIAAAKITGCRAVGIDLDPKRIRESRENALKEGMSARVTFLQQDLFDSDLGEADVVMLFLYPRVNLRLRPKLLSELKPGTRVVSHSHTMGEWEPDKKARVEYRNLYLWVIPGWVAGKWEWDADLGRGEEKFTMELQQEYQNVTGTINSAQDRRGLKRGKLNGTRLTFSTGKKADLRFDGNVAGDRIKGKIRTRSGEVPWEARRVSGGEKVSYFKILDFYP